MSWSSVALYTLTGTFTRPKAMEPFQMERIRPVCPSGCGKQQRAPTWEPGLRVGLRLAMRSRVQRGPIRQVSARARRRSAPSTALAACTTVGQRVEPIPASSARRSAPSRPSDHSASIRPVMNASPAPTVSTTLHRSRRHPHDPGRAHREGPLVAHRHRDDRRAQAPARSGRSARGSGRGRSSAGPRR